MARKHRHEEHENHEAWAIPYGDLVTLLLAFFVVMYAMSTLNEGKYRALSDSMSAAFRGTPRAIDPIEVGNRTPSAMQDEKSRLSPEGNMVGLNASLMATPTEHGDQAIKNDHGETRMDEIVGQVEEAMSDQILQQMIKVRRNGNGVEIEIRTDSLFPSGSASMSASSIPIMQKLADTLKTLPYTMRVEGHTDNRPISTNLFPSNWELSAARAATVVHLFTERGVDPAHLAVIGLGEFRPQEDNNTEAGRNANRRVRVIIMSDGSSPEGDANLKKALDDAEQSLDQQAALLPAASTAPTVNVAAPAAPATAPVSSPVAATTR